MLWITKCIRIDIFPGICARGYMSSQFVYFSFPWQLFVWPIFYLSQETMSIQCCLTSGKNTNATYNMGSELAVRAYLGVFFPRIQVTWFDKCKVMYFFYFWSDTGTTPYESCFFSFFLNLSAILGKYFTIYSKYHTVMQIMFPLFFFCKLGN